MVFFKTLLPIALLTSLSAGNGFCNKKTNEKKLFDALNAGDENICGDLLAKGVNVNARDFEGWTHLMLAIYNRKHECAEMILDQMIYHGIDVNAGDKSSKTALHFAAEGGNEHMCSTLLANGAEVSSPDNQFNTALHFAAKKGYENMCGALVENGANVNARNMLGKSPLMTAIEYKNSECAKSILKNYPNLRIESNIWMETALQIARRNKMAEMIKILEIGENEGIEEAVEFMLK